ncbi:hypothetical protein RRG08_030926 [Elysia crispata]|uniref:Uncharacterized protein n=1 Tax=Elysia crispata TaxID=231223 RepID=A0AAE1AAV4_9GAST|nr:hypothetical protein RRG08_030926 [Elysia crispata]
MILRSRSHILAHTLATTGTIYDRTETSKFRTSTSSGVSLGSHALSPGLPGSDNELTNTYMPVAHAIQALSGRGAARRDKLTPVLTILASHFAASRRVAANVSPLVFARQTPHVVHEAKHSDQTLQDSAGGTRPSPSCSGTRSISPESPHLRRSVPPRERCWSWARKTSSGGANRGLEGADDYSIVLYILSPDLLIGAGRVHAVQAGCEAVGPRRSHSLTRRVLCMDCMQRCSAAGCWLLAAGCTVVMQARSRLAGASTTALVIQQTSSTRGRRYRPGLSAAAARGQEKYERVERRKGQGRNLEPAGHNQDSNRLVISWHQRREK